MNGLSAFLARGAGGRQRQSPERLPDPRDRRRRRHAVHRDGAARRRIARRPAAFNCCASRRRSRSRSACWPRSRLHGRGLRPPRPEAVERVPDAAWRQAARLRPGRPELQGPPLRRAGQSGAWTHTATWRRSRRWATRSTRTDLFAAGRSCSKRLPAVPRSAAPPSSTCCTRRCTSSRRHLLACWIDRRRGSRDSAGARRHGRSVRDGQTISRDALRELPSVAETAAGRRPRADADRRAALPRAAPIPKRTSRSACPTRSRRRCPA